MGNKVLSLFGRALDQVGDASLKHGNAGKVWAQSARRIGAGVALTLAASAPHAQTNGVISTPEQQQAERTNTIASRIGVVLGAGVGLAASKDASGLVRFIATAGGAYAGASVAGALTSPDRGGRDASMGASGLGNMHSPATDNVFGALRGGPGDRIATTLRGRYNEPIVVTRAALEGAVVGANADMPPTAREGLRALEPDTHRGVYRLMVEAVASRATAVASLQESDRLRLAAQVDSGKAAAFSIADQTAREAFNLYNVAFRKVWDVLSMADGAGYDIWNQRLAMSAVPVDIRTPVQADLRWPGVQDRAVAIATDLVAVRQQRMDEIDGRAAKSALELRVAANSPAAPRQHTR